jgi:hypothetical protein
LTLPPEILAPNTISLLNVHAGAVRREIEFDNDDADSAWDVNAATLDSPLATADYSRRMSANRTDHLYNTEVDENGESTEFSEIANPPFDSFL